MKQLNVFVAFYHFFENSSNGNGRPICFRFNHLPQGSSSRRSWSGSPSDSERETEDDSDDDNICCYSVEESGEDDEEKEEAGERQSLCHSFTLCWQRMKWKLVLRDDAESDYVLFDLLKNLSNSTQGNLKKIILFLMFDIKFEIKGQICYFYCCISL